MRPAARRAAPAPAPAPAAPAQAPTAFRQLRSWVYRAIKQSLAIDVIRMPDRALPWVVPAVAAGLSLLRTGQFDAILSTSPPPTANLVASLLSRFTGLPWVADFRDMWTKNHSIQRAQPWQRWEERFEQHVLAPAARLVTVSEPLADQLSALHHKPVSVVTNGFDDPPTTPARPSAARDTTSKARAQLLLTYTGSLYPGRQDPTPLFQAVARIRAQRHLSADDLEIRFLGSDREYLDPLITQHDLGDIVTCHDPVPQLEAIAQQRASTALLSVTWSDTSFQGVYSLKVFEYLAANKPVLGVGPTGTVVDDLLRACEVGRVLDDPAEIAIQLETWLDELRHQGRLNLRGNATQIRQYHFRNLTAQLAVVLDEVTR